METAHQTLVFDSSVRHVIFLSDSVRHFAAQEHTFDKAFRGSCGHFLAQLYDPGGSNTLPLYTVNLNKHSIEPDCPRFLPFEIADARCESVSSYRPPQEVGHTNKTRHRCQHCTSDFLQPRLHII